MADAFDLRVIEKKTKKRVMPCKLRPRNHPAMCLIMMDFLLSLALSISFSLSLSLSFLPFLLRSRWFTGGRSFTHFPYKEGRPSGSRHQPIASAEMQRNKLNGPAARRWKRRGTKKRKNTSLSSLLLPRKISSGYS